MRRPLAEGDFRENRMEGVLHGWDYENHRYRVKLDLCWNGCDIKVEFKDHRHTDELEHCHKSEPSFRDQDVIAALAIANATLLAENYGFEK